MFLDGSWNTLTLKILQSIEKQDKTTLQVTLLFLLYIKLSLLSQKNAQFIIKLGCIKQSYLVLNVMKVVFNLILKFNIVYRDQAFKINNIHIKVPISNFFQIKKSLETYFKISLSPYKT